MKIGSWNVLYKNRTADSVFNYIKDANCDIFCLQEVPEHLLQRLKDLTNDSAYHFASSVDATLVRTQNEVVIYHVILSKYPIRNPTSFEVPHIILPLRTRILLRMKEGGWNIGKRENLFVDIEVEGKPLRVFSVHLTLSSPSARRQELEIIQTFMPKYHPSIIAGDFNLVEPRLLRLYGWLTGSTLNECMPWNKELTYFETYLKNNHLQNPLRRTMTHFFSRSQLDKILIPEEMKVIESGVGRNGIGSDHRPIFVTVA